MNDIINETLEKEKQIENSTIELGACQNYSSDMVLKAQGSLLSNKYIEGYFERRYNDQYDYIEKYNDLASDYAKKIFGVRFVNLYPHTISIANLIAYTSLLKKNEKILVIDSGLSDDFGFGISRSFMESNYKVYFAEVEKETCQINYLKLKKLALKEKPSLIIVSTSSYSRKIDFPELKEIASLCGAYLMVDMSYVSGLVVAGLYPNPCKYADIVTTMTNGSLRGPLGGIILSNNEKLMKKISKNMFLEIQGALLFNSLLAKATCFKESMSIKFINYQKQTVKNAKILCDILKIEGFKIITNGTDTHMFLIDVKKSVNMTGKEAIGMLRNIGITCDKNMIPFDETNPFITSGIKISTDAMTTRGMKEKEFLEIGKIIATCLRNSEDERLQQELKNRVKTLCDLYPIYKEVVYE